MIIVDVEYETMNYKGEQFKNILLELKKQYGKNLESQFSNGEIVDKIMEKYTDFLVSLYSRGELYFYHI